MVEEWNKRLPAGPKNRFDQPDRTAEKMFRNAFANGYRDITGRTYCVRKPILTKERLEAEASAISERVNKLVEAWSAQVEQSRKKKDRPPRR